MLNLRHGCRCLSIEQPVRAGTARTRRLDAGLKRFGDPPAGIAESLATLDQE
jgi:hypothetical protein